MSAVAYVSQVDLLRRQVEIFVGQDYGNGTYDAYLPNGVRQRLTENSGPTEPTLRLTHEEAKALLQALARFYDGGEDTRSLRKDYDAERGRVDKLTDTLVRLADKAVL